jgi:hypothetical protein
VAVNEDNRQPHRQYLGKEGEQIRICLHVRNISEKVKDLVRAVDERVAAWESGAKDTEQGVKMTPGKLDWH